MINYLPISRKIVFLGANVCLVVGIVALISELHFDPVGGRSRSREVLSQEFIRGDANDDGGVDISDGIFTINYLFTGGAKPLCLSASDTNDNGAIDISDAISVFSYLFAGGSDPSPPFPLSGLDPTPDLGCRDAPPPEIPPVGELGGPDRELVGAERDAWRRGRALFDRAGRVVEGLGPLFNGDSCRGCHLDPVLGGSGGTDVDVVRFASVDEFGVVSQLDGGPAAMRLSIAGVARHEAPPEANVFEQRQTPSLLGLGLIDRLPDAVILEFADPDDTTGDGISGRARFLEDGRLGRFGHKCGVVSLLDFTADAIFNELGLTVDPSLSPNAVGSDTDAVSDPEFGENDFMDLAFFIEHLAPVLPDEPPDGASQATIDAGEVHFLNIGCADCHRPEIVGSEGPVRPYSDFLLHDVGDPARYFVNETDVDPREFRTAPLWGLRFSAPYMHNGEGETITRAIELHHGEAQSAKENFQALDFLEQFELQRFLLSL